MVLVAFVDDQYGLWCEKPGMTSTVVFSGYPETMKEMDNSELQKVDIE